MTVYDQEQDTGELFSEGSPRRVKECLLSMQPSRALEIPLFSGEHIVLFKVDWNEGIFPLDYIMSYKHSPWNQLP